jgi:hypothetical protein
MHWFLDVESPIIVFVWHTYTKQGVAGLTKRDIQLIVDGGFNTVESVAYTPRRVLEQIKGISEQKAGKILAEGKSHRSTLLIGTQTNEPKPPSWCPWALPPPPKCTSAAAS